MKHNEPSYTGVHVLLVVHALPHDDHCTDNETSSDCTDATFDDTLPILPDTVYDTHMTDFDTQTTTLQITDTQSEPLAIEPTHMTEPTTTSFFTFDVATHTTLPRSHLTHITCDRMLYWT